MSAGPPTESILTQWMGLTDANVAGNVHAQVPPLLAEREQILAGRD